MRAIVCHEWGSIDQLTLEDIDKPMPGDGEVLIRVEASAVNFADSIMVAGR